MAEFVLPNLGENIDEADVLKILVAEGDVVAIDQPLLEIETEKATLDVPSEVAGRVTKIHIAPGDVVKPGQVLITVDGTSVSAAPPAPAAPVAAAPVPPPAAPVPPPPVRTAPVPPPVAAAPVPPPLPVPPPAPAAAPPARQATADAPLRVAVLGAGPGGYPAAFLAAEKGLDVTLIDLEPNPGGVCLYRGCIPSKALLHVANVVNEAHEAGDLGVTFAQPTIDVDRVRAWKDDVVGKLTGGLGQLSRARKVRYVRGRGRFSGPNSIRVSNEGELSEVNFDYAIIATGSSPAIPGPLRIQSDRIWDSTAALELREVPGTLLIIGGGYIGLEMASVYAALGSRVTVVEMTGSLLPGVDADLVQILQRRIEGKLDGLMLNTTVASLADDDAGGVAVELTAADRNETRHFDRVLIAVGRRPNTADLGLEHTKVTVNQRGFIEVDHQRRTGEPSIFAIGDVAGEPMLAHKATHEGRVAVETIAGEPAAWEPAAIPAVVFTDPEIAWCGLTENQARTQGIDVHVTKFPWAASGRALTQARSDGFTKLVLEPRTERVLGVAIVGHGAGELIGEGVLAVEMGATAEDLARTIHAHPTLAETVMESAELLFNTSPHYIARRR